MRRRLPISVALVIALVSAGCGGDDDTASGPVGGDGGSGADLEVLAEDISFPEDTYTAEAGTIDISYQNVGNIRHTLLVRDADGNDVGGFELEVSANGDVDTGAVDLESGEYELYCDVAGHEASGMVADLVVE